VNEPFEGVAFRAMAAGIPCIVPATLTAYELFEQGKYGKLFQKTEESEFIESLKELTQKEEEREEFSHSAQDLAMNELEKNRFCESLIALIKALPKKAAAS
jgi:glycosyltransferase involved in cell wall biosynthesis